MGGFAPPNQAAKAESKRNKLDPMAQRHAQLPALPAVPRSAEARASVLPTTDSGARFLPYQRVEASAGNPASFAAEPASVGLSAKTLPNRTGMSDQLKGGIESLSGFSLSDVKVHYNSEKPALLQAHAFTQGNQIHVAPGQERHLPHEAWHVVQQRQGRVHPTTEIGGIPVNDSHSLEREADLMGARALHAETGSPTQLLAAPSIASVQLKPVVQCSTDLDEANASAIVDMTEAKSLHEEAAELIEASESDPGIETEDMLFDDLEEVEPGGVSTRKMVTMEVFFNGSWHYYRLDHEEVPKYIQAAKERDLEYKIETTHLDLKSYQLKKDETLQLAVSTGYNGGKFNPAAAKPTKGAKHNRGAAPITNYGTTTKGTAYGASAIDMSRQTKGTGVGSTRPVNWVRFIAMCGATNPFVQGHQMNQRLGGDGTQDNLAPFTRSLNSTHYHSAEEQVIEQTFKSKNDQFANYSIDSNYNGNTDVRDWAHTQFDNMSLAGKIDAMVGAGIISAANGKSYKKSKKIPADKLKAAKKWLTDYVNAAFPTKIVCKAKFINNDAKNTKSIATTEQKIEITNEF